MFLNMFPMVIKAWLFVCIPMGNAIQPLFFLFIPMANAIQPLLFCLIPMATDKKHQCFCLHFNIKRYNTNAFCWFKTNKKRYNTNVFLYYCDGKRYNTNAFSLITMANVIKRMFLWIAMANGTNPLPFCLFRWHTL